MSAKKISTNFLDNSAVKIVGCFSNLTYNEESTDLEGYELIVINSAYGYHVLFIESIGEPLNPQLLLANVFDDNIEFTLPKDTDTSSQGLFVGKIEQNGLSGIFSKTGERVFLKKKGKAIGSIFLRPQKYLVAIQICRISITKKMIYGINFILFRGIIIMFSIKKYRNIKNHHSCFSLRKTICT